MQEAVTNLLYNVLVLLATVAAAFAVAWLKKRLGFEKLKEIDAALSTKQQLAAVAVAFVEQAYKEMDGGDKYDLAAKWLADQAENLGIKLTADEIKGLIEAALRAFKDEFGEQWAGTLDKTT